MALTSEEEYDQALEAFQLLYDGLEALRRDTPNVENFAVLAEGPIEQMSRVLTDMALYRAMVGYPPEESPHGR